MKLCYCTLVKQGQISIEPYIIPLYIVENEEFWKRSYMLHSLMSLSSMQ